MKKTRVQKMYKRFKNRVLRRKPGVEENQERRLPRQQLKLISSEPLTDLRTTERTSAVDDAAAPPSSQCSISRLSLSQCRPTVQSGIADTQTTVTLTSLPSRAACSELDDSTATILNSSSINGSTATYVEAKELSLCSKRAEGPCQSLAVATHSSSTATDDRGRQHGTPATTTTLALAGHPMLSADSGVEVDVLESCSGSCADDVFATDDEEEDLLLVDDDGWQIAAHDVSLDKILNETSCETVYSGYWHGSVEVHSRRSSDDELIRGIDDDVQTLSCIRHENIQLFLGVCHDLHSDYISIVMDQTKGQSLHSLIHRRGHQFSFQSSTKIMSQIAQGMEYLHAKGISHPLLTSRAVTVHYRVCISMLTPCGASQGLLDADDIIYLPPEAVRTISQAAPPQPIMSSTSPSSSSHQHRSAAAGCSRSGLKADSAEMHTDWANVFSFGTLVYEMMTMERPFAGVPTDLTIWEVGNERVFPLRKLHDGCRFRQIVGNCWRADPERRPTFEDLLLTLENNMSPRACGLKSPFSFSEPSQLAKLGL